MNANTAGKLIGGWCALMLSVPLAFFLLRPDFAQGSEASALTKLFVALAAVSAAGLAISYFISRKWAARTRLLQQFVTALPASTLTLSGRGPEELESLERAMRSMAERVRQVVERASLELSRRETILACMAEGVLAVDQNLKVVFCNDAFAAAFGTRTPVAEGRSLYEVVREPALRDILERVVNGGAAERDLLRLPSAAGRSFEVRSLSLGEQPRRGAVIALHDVTDIERQERARKDFVADVSHELRTPLAAIRGYAETLLDGALEDQANNRKFVEIILAHSVRLNNIASDLLVLSELDSASGHPTPPERVRVLEVVESAFHTVGSGAHIRGVRLIRDRCQDSVVMGHRFRLEQVLVNLMDNAVKFNRPDGEVCVECGSMDDGQVRISVGDTGIGIPSEDLKRIFERFYRVDKARSRRAGGTGLGLPIVKEMVERMGGTISVESQLGRGSKFTVLLKGAE
ncbi:MAG TPA: ATP-binding protein [Bryobacteraceae bacterium]|nr:ATP-binding protein [Bryobacteraceae bacterium]